MIYTNVTVKVNSNGTATSNSKVVLYRGDREVEIQITLAGNPFIVQDSTFAQLIIRRPEASPVITGIAPLKDNKVILTITEQNIDELTEVGEYAYQVRLYDDDMSSRITLPPVENGLEVREPIVDEASGQIGRAMVGYSLVSRAYALENNETFNEYDEYNRTYWADGDFITEGKMNKIEDALYTINQRVLSNAESAYISTNMQEDQIVGIGESLDITFTFISPNQGRGTMKVMVDGLQKISQYVEQDEEITVNLPEEYFKKGENKVSVIVVDRAGKTSNELVFYVRYGSTEITSDFDSNAVYQYGASVRFYFTPTALDTNQELLFYMVIDGEVKPPMTCKSDVRGYYTFPNNLSIGAHECQAYIVDASGKQSNIIDFNMVVLDAYSIAIASNTRVAEVEEGDQLSIDYRVYMQYGKQFKIKVYIDGSLVQEGTCGLATEYYRTSSLLEGTYKLKIEAWDIDETVSDYIEFDVFVLPSEFQRVESATAGGVYLATAKDKSNSDTNRNTWVGKNQDGNDVVANLTNFTFDDANGWIDNELIFNGTSGMEIPIKPLANNARYGFTLDIEFTSKPIGVDDALVLDLWDYNKNCGVKITTEEMIIRSAAGNETRLYYEEDVNTSAMFVIDRNEKKAKIYLNGVMCAAFNLSDYEANGVMTLEDFTVDDTIKIAGSGYCKIRNIRVYEVALTTDEIINNFISNVVSKEEQKELVDFQKGTHLPTLTIYCDFSGLGKDDKKPCKITYTSTDEEKYGPSFTLDHKMSTCQYQGTSSMAYPIKNYRINLADETGAKWKYAFPYGQPEHRFTLKADFMSSGHWQNTGLTKWVNNNLYNYNINDEKSMNPKKWFDIQNGGKLEDTRECIYGFPCRLILINDGNTPLNAGQNEPAPGNMKDMGIFNFNHDKDATDTMGFDQDNFPNCMSFEVTANSDTSAGAFMSPLIDIPYYGSSSYASINIPIFEFKEDVLMFESDGNLSSLCIRRAANNNSMEGYFNANTGLDLKKYPTTKYIQLYFSTESMPTYLKINHRTFNMTHYDDNQFSATGYESIFIQDQDELLEYLQQSFEMRFPDPDDYDDWHGYLGLNAGTMVTDYIPVEDGYSTTQWNWDWSQMSLSIDSASTLKTIECYYGDEFLANINFNKTNGNAQLIDGTNKIRFIFESIPEYFRINDVKYIFGNEVAALDVIDPYLGEEISHEYGLKRVIDWVDNCSDTEFVRDFEQYFHKDYTLRYYLLVITLGMVDNLGKNMMFDTWDSVHWMPRFYDCDTICSYDNTGDIAFDVDIEMEQGYWNTSSSRLWTRIRDLFHNELVVKYQDMRQNGLSYESLMECFYGEQISKIPQKYYNMDYDVKYAPFGESYMGMAHGDGYVHLKRWLKKRLYFTDSLFDYAPSYNNEILTIRANTTDLMTLNIEVHDPVYVHLSWYNGQMDKKKIGKGESISFSGRAMAATDQEVLIYGGSNIKKISGIASTNPSELIIGTATRLTELDASNCAILTQINLNKANLSPHTHLLKLKLDNCPQLNGTLRIENSPLLQELSIANTGISTINFATNLKNLRNVSFANCKSLETLDLSTWDVRHITDMRSMFANCTGLKTLNVSGWDTSNVTNMQNMFVDCMSLETLDLSSWNVSKVTTFNDMFGDCQKLKSVDISTWRFDSATNMGGMFLRCYALQEFVFPGLYAPNVISMASMFDGCRALTNVVLTNSHFPKLTNISRWFSGCSSLKGVGTILCNFSKVVNMDNVFASCSSLTNVAGLETWDVGNVTDISGMFTGTGFTSLNLSKWNTSSLKKAASAFANMTSLETINLDDFITSTNTDISNMFGGCEKLKNLYVNNWDVSGTTGFYGLFNQCRVLESVDTSTWISGPNNVNGGAMFQACNGLKNVNLSGLRNSKLTSMHNMFYGTAVETLDLSMLDLSQVTTMLGAFGICKALKSITFPDMSNTPLENTGEMFRNCEALQRIDLSGWNNTKITSALRMFSSCTSLESINLSGWETTPDAVMNYAFEGCSSLTTLDIPDMIFGSANTTYTGTFNGCDNLRSVNARNADYNTAVFLQRALLARPENDPGDIAIEVAGDAATALFRQKNWNVANGVILAIVTGTVQNIRPNISAGAGEITSITSELVEGNIYRSRVYGWPGFTMMNFSTFTQLRTVEHLRIDKSITSLENMFNGCTGLVSVNIDGWDTSNVINFYQVFRGCHKLTTITGDFNKWDTRKVTNMQYMFTECKALPRLDVSGWDVSRVTMFHSMFNGCTELTELNISSWQIGVNTGSATVSMWNFMSSCPKLVNLNMSNIRVTNVVDNYAMFHNAQSLRTIDLNGWDLSKSTNVSGMFMYCYALENINFEGCTWSKVATSMASLFHSCRMLTQLDLSFMDVSTNTSLDSTFLGCESLTSIDTTGWNTEKVTSFYSTFHSCKSLTNLDLSHWNVKNVTTVYNMFHSCSALKSVNTSGWDTGKVTNTVGMFTGCASLETMDLSHWDVGRVTDAGNMFYGCSSLKSFNANGWNSERVTSLYGFFSNCTNLTSPGIETINVSKVTTFQSMFQNCASLETIDLSAWRPDSLTSMVSMFANDASLETVNMSGWVNTKLENMDNVFGACRYLVEANLENLDTSRVTNMNNVFSGCTELSRLNIKGWDTSKVRTMTNMFANCQYLVELDVNHFKADSLTNLSGFVSNCPRLVHIYFDKWLTKEVLGDRIMTMTTWMQNNCTLLEDDIELHLCKVSKQPTIYGRVSCTALGKLHPVIDFDGVDTSKMATIEVYQTDTTHILNLHSEVGFTIGVRDSKVHTIQNLHLKAPRAYSIGYWYYGVTGSNVNYTFETHEGCEEYKAENWTDGGSATTMSNLLKPSAYSVASLVSLFNCLYDYTANNEVSSMATLRVGSTNIARLTSAQIAIATNKGWTITA